jgi:CHAT domain-containing protein/Tfp pilus assembly protein PilF
MIRPHLWSTLIKYHLWVVYYGLILSISPPLIRIHASPDPLLYSSEEVKFYAGVTGSAQETQQTQQIEPGKPIKRELAGGQSHSYRMTLAAGQYVKLVVDQRGIDVIVGFSGSDRKQVIIFDSESRIQGQETVSLVAEAADNYRLVVVARYKNAAMGRYEIQMVEMRGATEDDRALHEARRLNTEFVRLYNAGNYDEARSLAERVLEIRERVLGSEHPDVAQALNSLAVFYGDIGDYARAEPLYERALTIREKSLGLEHIDVAITLSDLANLYKDRGYYAKAEQLYQRALTIWEKSLGPEHPDVATTLGDLAGLYQDKGYYAEAEPLLQRVLIIKERALGQEHLHVGISLNNLANLYLFKGDYATAEPFYQRSLVILEKVLGPEHPDLATSLDNLALLYRNRGDYAKAEQILQRTLTIREKALGQEHPGLARSLNSLAFLYMKKGDYERAEPFYQRALAIREKALGPKHPDVAASLNNLGTLYLTKGDYERAEPFYRRALAIREKALGPEHPYLANSLNDLASLYCKRGNYAEAKPIYERALAIREKSLGPEHPDVADSLNNLARLYAAKGDITQAITILSRANAVYERNFADNLAIGSERQKLAYLDIFSKHTDYMLSLQSQAAPNDPEALNLAFTTLLQRKGRGLDAMTDTIATLRRKATPQDQELLSQLIETRSRLAALTLKVSDATKPDIYRTQVKPLEDEVDELEGKLSSRSAKFRANKQPVTLAAVQAALPAGSALVEFAYFTPLEPQTEQSKSPRYLAYVLASQGQARWVDLGEAAMIDRAVYAWRKALRDPNRTDVKRLARAVDKRVMRPVRSLLNEMMGGKRRLLIAPDGSLNLIPFAALVDELNQYLVERYSISYLTSGRDLLRLQTSEPSNDLPLVVANPDFGKLATIAMRGGQVTSRTRNQARSQINTTQVFFQPLPGTEDEALAIKALIPKASVLRRGEATETALKQASGPHILHIATHGFFLNYHEAPSAEGDSPRAVSSGTARLAYAPHANLLPATEPLSDLRLSKFVAQVKDPLLRSGLALAGANHGKSGDDDGVLTALEAAYLDLSGTKLVVLSACDTGVGEVKNGEGVQGLRRALVLAGSESQVISLWPVSDEATKDLMIHYYKALQQGKGRSEGLRQVQLRMLRGHKDRRHPFYWAAFIQSGEWANLDGKQ